MKNVDFPLDRTGGSSYNTTVRGAGRTILYPGVAQLVARMVRDHEAVGSNPATRTKNRQNLKISAVFLIEKLQKFLSNFSDHMFSHRWQKNQHPQETLPLLWVLWLFGIQSARFFAFPSRRYLGVDLTDHFCELPFAFLPSVRVDIAGVLFPVRPARRVASLPQRFIDL